MESSGTGRFLPCPDCKPRDVGEGLAARSLQTSPSPLAGSGHGVLGRQPPAFLWPLDPGQWRNVPGSLSQVRFTACSKAYPCKVYGSGPRRLLCWLPAQGHPQPLGPACTRSEVEEWAGPLSLQSSGAVPSCFSPPPWVTPTTRPWHCVACRWLLLCLCLRENSPLGSCVCVQMSPFYKDTWWTPM